LNKIYAGSALDVLKSWPDGFIDCLVCSPPYWGLRDYGVSGQLGLESTFQEYIAKLIQIFDEVKRVLKPTGTCWVNLGDSYFAKNPSNRNGVGSESWHGEEDDPYAIGQKIPKINRDMDYPAKSLCCIPDRFKIAMVDKGWICRNEIIWFKRNCMPASVTDRFTVDFEKIYFFSKSSEAQFWTNSKTAKLVSQQPAGTQGIENEDWEWRDCPACNSPQGITKITPEEAENLNSPRARYHRQCNKKRCVNGKVKSSLWEGHDYWFEQQFEAATSEGSVHVGKKGDKGSQIKETVNATYFDRTYVTKANRNVRCVWDITTKGYKEAHFATFPEKLIEPMIKAGCPPGGIVADTFMGSGTTAVVAKKLGRQWVGIELNEKYVAMANRRLENTVVNGVMNL